MITAVYIGTERLDLFEDETFEIKSSVARIEDITKVYTDISNDITVPATDKNNATFKHWYNADIINGFDARKKVPSTIENDGLNYRFGKIRLKKVNFKHNQPTNYTIGFFGNLVELKDKLQDDKLTDLSLSSLDFVFNSANVKSRLQTVGDVSFSLLSKRRLLYDSSNSVIDDDKQTNIFFNGTDNNTGLRPSDILGSVKQIKIIEAIESKYNLTFSRDHFGLHDFDSQFMALSGAEDNTAFQIPLTNPDEGIDPTVSGNIMMADGFGNALQRATSYLALSIFIATGYEDAVYTIYIKNGDKVVVKKEKIKNSLIGGNQLSIKSSAINGEIKDVTYWIESNEPIVFDARCYRYTQFFPGRYRYYPRNLTPTINYTVANRLPDIKIIDYIKGIFKMSKLVAIAEKDGSIYVDSLQQYYRKGKVYDLSDHIEYDKHTVSAGNILNEINYQFEEPQTILNQQFVKQNDRGYGDLELKIYEDPNADPKVLIDGKKLDFKLPFEQIVYEKIKDINDQNSFLTMQYGLLQDENLEFVTIKPHIHYIETFKSNYILPDPGAIKYIEDNQTATFLDDFNCPLHIIDLSLQTFSTTFRNEFSTYDGNSIDNNLYTNYHKNYIESVFNIQKREYNFTAIEVPTYIVLNLKLNDVIEIKGKFFRIDEFTTNTKNNNIQFKLINDRKVDLTPMYPVSMDSTIITMDSTMITMDATTSS